MDNQTPLHQTKSHQTAKWVAVVGAIVALILQIPAVFSVYNVVSRLVTTIIIGAFLFLGAERIVRKTHKNKS